MLMSETTLLAECVALICSTVIAVNETVSLIFVGQKIQKNYLTILMFRGDVIDEYPGKLQAWSG